MTPRIIALLVVAVLALPATVSAKPLIHSVEACGEEACKEITAAFDVEPGQVAYRTSGDFLQ